MLDAILTSVYYLIAATLWYAIYRSGRAMVRRVRIRKYLGGILFFFPTIFLIWVGLEFGAVPGSSMYKRCYYAWQTFGKVVLLGSPRYNYDSERAFNGDGHSIDVYDIPDSFAAWAEAPQAEFMSRYPMKPSYRSRWQSTTWHKTPIQEDERKFLDFALSEYNDTNTKLQSAHKSLQKLANEPGNYIAIFFYMHGEHVVMSISFY